ncbi:hypothetical protein SAMN05421640_2483 [Ekhidna lutea]|uniref:SusE outer membrane protein n=1 Tax=Ekhidna lutea TaxID=447679 RepID=A0A239K6S5_EKHLU|nr:hypothetical protein [Ekhidna lutea]SNT14156.1 hypothetical protein SAMN05421640_2483 [Ekhidna lutea]
MKSKLSKKTLYFIIPALVWMGISCDEFIEPDISNKQVNLIAPGDNITIDSSRVVFFWDHLPEALDYSFQIVTGNFDSPDILIFDTLIVNNKITLNLDSGTYQWGVSALNSNYQTAYSVRSLTINNKSAAKGSINLLFPQNQQTLADTTFQFNWNTSANIEEYVFKILELPEKNAVTSNSFILRSFPKQNASYQWQVIGLLEGRNETIESPIYTFTIDPN